MSERLGRVVLVVLCLAAVGGAYVMGCGLYREIYDPISGPRMVVIGLIALGFTGIAIPLVWHYLYHQKNGV
jgi:hypothetical protein